MSSWRHRSSHLSSPWRLASPPTLGPSGTTAALGWRLNPLAHANARAAGKARLGLTSAADAAVRLSGNSNTSLLVQGVSASPALTNAAARLVLTSAAEAVVRLSGNRSTSLLVLGVSASPALTDATARLAPGTLASFGPGVDLAPPIANTGTGTRPGGVANPLGPAAATLAARPDTAVAPPGPGTVTDPAAGPARPCGAVAPLSSGMCPPTQLASLGG